MNSAAATPEPHIFECAQCERPSNSVKGCLPAGWTMFERGEELVCVCADCRRTLAEAERTFHANDDGATAGPMEGPETRPLIVDDRGLAWISFDLAPGQDRTALRVTDARTLVSRCYRLHPDVDVSHWPMPELGGAAILLSGHDDNADGVLFTSDGPRLDRLIVDLQRIRGTLS